MSKLVPLAGPQVLQFVNYVRSLTALTPTDSASVVLKITDPSGTTTTTANGSLTRPGATGVYWSTWTPAAVGLYVIRWESSTLVIEEFVEVTSAVEAI